MVRTWWSFILFSPLAACVESESGLPCPGGGPALSADTVSAHAGLSAASFLARVDGTSVSGEVDDGRGAQPATASFTVLSPGVARDVDLDPGMVDAWAFECGLGPHLEISGVALEVELRTGGETVEMRFDRDVRYRVYGPGDGEAEVLGAESMPLSLPPALAASASDHVDQQPGFGGSWVAYGSVSTGIPFDGHLFDVTIELATDQGRTTWLAFTASE